MNKMLIVIFCFCGLLIGSFDANSSTELDSINAAVQKKVKVLDSDYGITLSDHEKTYLKISLIVNILSKETKFSTVREKAEHAYEKYQIYEQEHKRQLLIEMQAASAKDDDGDGLSPPK